MLKQIGIEKSVYYDYKENIMSQESRIYRVNPFCPSCMEEHAYYDVEISEEEQKIVDDYYEQHKNETTLRLLLSPAPLYVEREFQCPCCKKIFTKMVGIVRECRIEYLNPDTIPIDANELA